MWLRTLLSQHVFSFQISALVPSQPLVLLTSVLNSVDSQARRALAKLAREAKAAIKLQATISLLSARRRCTVQRRTFLELKRYVVCMQALVRGTIAHPTTR